jgi:hypothetical protein
MGGNEKLSCSSSNSLRFLEGRYLELRMFDDAALALEEIKPYAKGKRDVN